MAGESATSLEYQYRNESILMKTPAKLLLAALVLSGGLAILADSAHHANDEQINAAAISSAMPTGLRPGDFSCDKATIQTAAELKNTGWTYIMPEPKSPQAAWGHLDGRTTWWVGYWVNGRSGATSRSQPAMDSNGQSVGDGEGGPAWRRGGTPPPPTKTEWMCSSFGGIPPR
jgi:hypothetical protein